MYRCLFAFLLCACQLSAVSFAAVSPLYYWWEPRILSTVGTQGATLHVIFNGTPTVATMVRPNATSIPLTHAPTGEYTLSLTHAQIMEGYQAGDMHNFIGYLDVYDGVTRVGRLNTFISLRTPAMPDAIVQSLGSDIQYSDHVVNIRWDTLVTPNVPQDPVKRLYQFFPDQFDFLAVIQQRNAIQNRYYMGLRNDIQGIGMAAINNGAAWGSNSALQGIVCYPVDAYYDLGETAASHELGHRWINYLTLPILTAGQPHWPMSDIASHSLMGFNIPGSSVGGSFPYEFTAIANGQYQLNVIPIAQEFDDMDLYLMGLIPAAEVPVHQVFQNQNQNPSGGVLSGPLVSVSIADVVAAAGTRVPAANVARKAFRIGTIVLSLGGLLTADEMSFFDYMAARGELRTTLSYSSGMMRGTTKPFFLATGGRGRLSTRTANLTYTPHFGYGQGLSTTFVAVNPSSSRPVKGRVVPLDSDGRLIPIAAPPFGWIHEADVDLPPLGTRFLSTPGTGALQIGSVTFRADGQLAGTTIFGGSFGMAGVAAAPPVEKFIVPVWTNAESGLNSGIAIVNPYGVQVAYTATLRTSWGMLIPNGQVSGTLPPFGQIARFPQELFAGKLIGFSDFLGTLEVGADMPLAGMAMVQTSQEMATLPVAPINEGVSSLRFPQFANGSGITSSIILVNPSTSHALHATAYIRDKNGNTWTLVLNGVSRPGTVAVDIPPLGTIRLTSDGTGAVVVGSVRVTADGPIAGTAFFQASSGVAGVGSSEEATRVIVPVETLASAGLSTGVAVLNPNFSPVMVTYRLRAANGIAVGSAESMAIPGGGQLAQFVEEIFAGKGIDLSNFKGSCDIAASAKVAAIALRARSGQLAAFPVAVID